MGNTDGDIKNEAKYKLNYSQHKTKQKSNKHVSTTVFLVFDLFLKINSNNLAPSYKHIYASMQVVK